MCVGCVVVTCVDGALVSLRHGRILLGKLRVDVTLCVLLALVVDVEADTQRKHILTLHNRLVIQAHIGQCGLCHSCDVGNNHVVTLQAKLLDGVQSSEASLLEVILGDGVAVDDYRCVLLQPLAVSLQRCGVHSHQRIAEVARVSHLA